jgi:hypothetical protein
MLKKIVAAAALVLLPVIASASDLPDYPFIHVSGNGSIYVPPDTGEVDFEAAAYGADPAEARKVVEARVAEVRALVASLGLADAAVEIRDIRKEIRKPDPAQPHHQAQAGRGRTDRRSNQGGSEQGRGDRCRFRPQARPGYCVSTGDLKNLTRAMGLAASDPFRSRSAGQTSYDREGLLMINTTTMGQSVDVIFRIK